MAWRNLGRVKGDTGDTGAQGPQGPQGSQGVQGPAGVGVPDGGTAGQALKKYGDNDYQTYWADCYEVPTNGQIGQVLKKYGTGANHYAWADESGGGGGSTPFVANVFCTYLNSSSDFGVGSYENPTNLRIDTFTVTSGEFASGSYADIMIVIRDTNGNNIATFHITGIIISLGSILLIARSIVNSTVATRALVSNPTHRVLIVADTFRVQKTGSDYTVGFYVSQAIDLDA